MPPINIIMDAQYIVPAEVAGIQKPRMASSNHILVIWIPAVHAGMTCFFDGMNKLTDAKTVVRLGSGLKALTKGKRLSRSRPDS